MIYIAGMIIAILLLALWLAYAKINELKHQVHKAVSIVREANKRAVEADAKAITAAAAYIKKKEKKMRADAIKRSAAVIKGKVAEQLVPFTEAFGYAPRDCRFLGAPIDFLVFEGMSDGEIDRVVFVEVKTGLSSLSKRERQVRNVVDRGDVFYEVLRVDSKGAK